MNKRLFAWARPRIIYLLAPTTMLVRMGSKVELPPFPGEPNEALLKLARLNPDMKGHDFVYIHLKHAKNLDRLCSALCGLDITPEQLCSVDPTLWIKYLKGFGPACAKSLYEAMKSWKPVSGNRSI